MFVLTSDITIGNFQFSGVNEVYIQRSLHSITDTAIIKIPSIGKIITGNKSLPGTVITGKQFSDGDPVTIKLCYNGNLQTEFIGFVKRRNLNMPLEIECEGYSWLLRRNNIQRFEKQISIKDLLTLAISGINGYEINIECGIDLSLEKVYMQNRSGFDILNDLSRYTDNCLTCFFIQPNTLWCGLLYTATARGDNALNMGQVSYRLGYNVVKNNNLKERLTENDPVQIQYNSKISGGDIISQTSDVYANFVRIQGKVLNTVKDATALKQLANEKAYQLNYSGYEGSINAFLQPYASPGYTANVTDDRYPERNGTYIIESTEVYFGVNGARRIIELGPQLGFVK